MKATSKYLLLTVIVLFQISISNAQRRILSIEDGISLMGVSKNQMNAILNESGYAFDNSSGEIIAYSKYIDDYKYYLTIAYKKSIVSVVEWTENGAYLPMYNNDIVANMGFTKDKEFDTGEAHVFSYKNYARNLNVNFTWRYIDDKLHFLVVIGKNKATLSVKTEPQKVDVNVQAINYDRSINLSKLKEKFFFGSYINENQKEIKRSYDVKFFDPYDLKINALDSVDNKIGEIKITDLKTGKIFKKYYVTFLYKQADKYNRDTSFWYKILNQDEARGQSTLILDKWNKPYTINKMLFNYDIIITTHSEKDNEISISCNTLK